MIDFGVVPHLSQTTRLIDGHPVYLLAVGCRLPLVGGDICATRFAALVLARAPQLDAVIRHGILGR